MEDDKKANTKKGKRRGTESNSDKKDTANDTPLRKQEKTKAAITNYLCQVHI